MNYSYRLDLNLMGKLHNTCLYFYSYYIFEYKNTSHTNIFIILSRWGVCGPRISGTRTRFPLDGETRFLFENIEFYLFKNDLESPLIFVLFLKGKQNNKEKP